MAVLELTDESRALREAAKGWSAGNIPLEDYRMIRRATLGAMLGIDPDEEETVAGFVGEGSDDTETVEHYPTQAPGPDKRNMMLVIAAAAVIIVGGALALLLAG